MGVVYHTHYLDFFEVGRTEALRDVGIRYRDLEDDGIIMPVVEVEGQYHGPARYAVRRDGEDDVLVTGHTTLCFMDAERRRPTRAPAAVRDAFAAVLDV